MMSFVTVWIMILATDVSGGGTVFSRARFGGRSAGVVADDGDRPRSSASGPPGDDGAGGTGFGDPFTCVMYTPHQMILMIRSGALVQVRL